MTKTTIQLRGPAAIAVLLAAGGILAFQVMRTRSLGPEELQDLRTRLAAEYTGRALPDLEAALRKGDRDHSEEVAAAVLAMQDIRFPSVKARGTKEVVVRVEISVHGQPPPRGASVRYFELEHGPASGWRVRREVGAPSYYLKLL